MTTVPHYRDAHALTFQPPPRWYIGNAWVLRGSIRGAGWGKP